MSLIDLKTKDYFEHIGYFVEHLIDGKLIGCTTNKDIKDDRKIGYVSTETHIASSDIVFGKKRIKKGQTYQTRVYPLCGKLKKQ